ncbi:methyl-accepting chemotaxis protein [Thiomonas sp. FB-6]|uniref:methyl-accepting chemotaxis protein n=1 Tax=Thiomonas sp. FB-6 TaxID=1158291 RepID=UPI0003711016
MAGTHARAERLAASMAQQAAQHARGTGEAVQRTVQDMRAIAERISVVDDIAYQTNMLALNAAIEAAGASQASGIARIHAAMPQVNAATQHNASAPEQLAATAEQMRGQAAALRANVERFLLEA